MGESGYAFESVEACPDPAGCQHQSCALLGANDRVMYFNRSGERDVMLITYGAHDQVVRFIPPLSGRRCPGSPSDRLDRWQFALLKGHAIGCLLTRSALNDPSVRNRLASHA